MNIEQVLERVPDYKDFLTVEEMDKRTLELAKKYPDVVKVEEIGRSRWNHPIYCLTIGSGSQNALIFGCPHPNEPIGAMMLDFLTEELATNKELREELDYTWYIVKTSDPDGTALNEGWFKGPFTVTNYINNFYRPAYHQQVEWSFPIEYKTLRFDSPIPETQALIKIIDDKKPTFIYSLHNAGFGGCYWYLSEGDEELYQELYKAPAREQIPLSLGEPEMPYCTEFYPAVYKMVGVKANYDYLEQYGKGDPADMITSGTSSDEYANADGTLHARALINEMPYFFDPRVDDTTESTRTRVDCLLECCDEMERIAKLTSALYEKVKTHIKLWNPFMISVQDRVTTNQDFDPKREWARNNPEFAKPATVCQEFDSTYVSRFYGNLNFALLYRGCKWELEQNKELTADDVTALQEVKDSAYEAMMQNCKYLEENGNYTAIPIAKLVKIQAASGLIYARYAHKRALEQ